MDKSWRTATIAASLALVLAGVWGISQYNSRLDTERRLAANYQERFFEAVGNVENVEVLLSKGMVVATSAKANDQLSVSVFSDLWRQAFAAQANLTQLPLLQGTLLRTSKFLTQVGDFGFSVGRKIAQGEKLSDKDMATMTEFRKEAGTLNAALRDVQTNASSGRMPWDEVQRGTNTVLRQESKKVDDNDFTRIEKQATEFPTLIYDGPFSDHILQREPKGLTGSPVSEGRAEEIAQDFMAEAGVSGLVGEVIGRADGDIPAYQIRLRRPGREEEVARLDVSRKGGHVVWMFANGSPSEKENLSIEEAARKGKDFLQARGFENVVPTYASKAGGTVVVPFAPVQDGVIIYPDLLKVTVNLDTGRVVGFEAMGYLMQHQEREIPKASIDADKALEAVSPDLKVTEPPKLALIPLETLDEVLTYEVKGTMGNDYFVNYVNARTGKIERVLQILATPEGPLAQ